MLGFHVNFQGSSSFHGLLGRPRLGLVWPPETTTSNSGQQTNCEDGRGEERELGVCFGVYGLAYLSLNRRAPLSLVGFYI